MRKMLLSEKELVLMGPEDFWSTHIRVNEFEI